MAPAGRSVGGYPLHRRLPARQDTIYRYERDAASQSDLSCVQQSCVRQKLSADPQISEQRFVELWHAGDRAVAGLARASLRGPARRRSVTARTRRTGCGGPDPEGLGIVGDRYFGKHAHRDASVTLIASESLPPGVDLAHVRRNVLLRGIAVDDLVGSVLALDSGDGPVRLRLNRRANPCAWMDVAIAPGAWRGLRGKGGVRCIPLNDGLLRVGPVTLTIET